LTILYLRSGAEWAAVVKLLVERAFMRCRNCGTEIADKALICYKCGTATMEAKYQPYIKPKRRSTSTIVWTVIAIAVLVLLAWFLLHSTSAQAPL
jgi:uncharacterized membrane protein YvbJ